MSDRARASWYIAFMLLMIAIALSCIVLFGRALFRPQLCYPKEIYIDGLEIPDKWLILMIVFLISIVPLLLLGRQLLRAYKDPDQKKPTEVLLHLSVHAVPYGILSLSMLFEYQRLIEGEAEGAAALASIMILFILSEMALILFTEIREAARVSGRLSKSLLEVRDTEEKLHIDLEGMAWLKRHAEITHSSTAVPSFVDQVGLLLAEWHRLLSPPAPFRRILMNVLLDSYLREEVKDVSGRVDSTRLPEGMRLSGSNHYQRVSVFATNIDLYACYLERAVDALSKAIGGRADPVRRACIVAVTTALPTQFWNWPKNHSDSVEYKPVAHYREAQFDAVENGLTRIFRTVLVADTPGDKVDAEAPEANDERATTPEEPSVLRCESEWQEQAQWLLILDKKGKPLTRQDVRFPYSLEFLVPNLKWTRGEMVSSSSPATVYWMAVKELRDHLEEKKAGEDVLFKLMSVWEFYCCQMHGSNNLIGRTEVMPVTKKIFNGEWGSGFGGCRDLMFLGTCASEKENVWEDDSVEWGIALMTSMSTRTETMFIVAMHESQYIKDVWSNVSEARRLLNIHKRLSDSHP